MSADKKLIVVTGASGHLGANLVRALLKRGDRVRVLVRRDRRAIEDLAVETVRGDILDPDSLLRAFAGAASVYHAAGSISITGDPHGDVYRTNVIGTRNVVEACLNRGAGRLVHFSSVHALCAGSGGDIIDENRAPAVTGREAAYDRSKALGEKEIREGIKRGLSAVIIKPTAIIGPHDYKPSRVGQFLLALCRNRIPALLDGGYDWVDARDVAQLAMAAGRAGGSGESYLASGRWAHLRDIARMAGKVRPVLPLWLGRAAAPLARPCSRVTGSRPLFTPEAIRALRRRQRVCHDKAARELGYRPRPLEESVRETLAWFRKKGMLPVTPGKPR